MTERVVVFAGDEGAEGDRVIVNGTTMSDTIRVMEHARNAAYITRSRQSDVAIVETELLLIEGQIGNDTLQIDASSGAETFVHLPSSQLDSGRVVANTATGLNQGVALLPIEYSGLGPAATIRFVGEGENERLILRGTEGRDEIHVATIDPFAASAVITMDTLLGRHTPVHFDGIHQLAIQSLGDSDTISVGLQQGGVGAEFGVTATVDATSPKGIGLRGSTKRRPRIVDPGASVGYFSPK